MTKRGHDITFLFIDQDVTCSLLTQNELQCHSILMDA